MPLTVAELAAKYPAYNLEVVRTSNPVSNATIGNGIRQTLTKKQQAQLTMEDVWIIRLYTGTLLLQTAHGSTFDEAVTRLRP